MKVRHDKKVEAASLPLLSSKKSKRCGVRSGAGRGGTGSIGRDAFGCTRDGLAPQSFANAARKKSGSCSGGWVWRTDLHPFIICVHLRESVDKNFCRMLKKSCEPTGQTAGDDNDEGRDLIFLESHQCSHANEDSKPINSGGFREKNGEHEFHR